MEEVLVDVGAVGADVAHVGEVLAALVVLLAEELFHSPAVGARVVDAHVVIFGVHRLLHERLLHLHAVQHDVLLVLLKVPDHLPLRISLHDKIVGNLYSLQSQTTVVITFSFNILWIAQRSKNNCG